MSFFKSLVNWVKSWDPVYVTWWYLAKWYPRHFGTGAQKNALPKIQLLQVKGRSIQIEVEKISITEYKASWNHLSNIGKTPEEAISLLTASLNFWMN